MIAPYPSHGSWILTASGRRVDLLRPRPDDIYPEDIAHALSHLCRFGGHTCEFYSVAQHCLLVAQMLPPELKLAGLLHDATEAYLGDVVSPLKRQLYRYRLLEARMRLVIEERFGLFPGALDVNEVRYADRMALAIERTNLMPYTPEAWPDLVHVQALDVTVVPLPPEAARDGFLTRLAQITEHSVAACEGPP